MEVRSNLHKDFTSRNHPFKNKVTKQKVAKFIIKMKNHVLSFRGDDKNHIFLLNSFMKMHTEMGSQSYIKLRALILIISILVFNWLMPGHIQATQTVKVGVFECPPFVIKEANGTYSGLTMLLIDNLAKERGGDYSYQDFTLEGLLEAVSNGQVDIGATCLSITPEREEILDFSHSFYETHLAIAVKKQGYITYFKSLFTNKELLVFLLVICGAAGVIGTFYYVLENRINEKLYAETSTGRKLTEGFLLGLLFITKGPFNYYEFKTLAGRAMTVLLAVATTFFIASCPGKFIYNRFPQYRH